MEYDVFISCKSEDYELAEEVYQYLKDNDIHAFLSSKELRRMKEAEYMDAICEALDTSYHLVVLASSKENVTSKWVKFEWTTFLNEMLSGRKKGQMVTFLKDVKVEELPIQLRHYETFSFDDYKDRFVHYVETPAYSKRKEEMRLKAEEEEKKRKAQMEEVQRKEEIRKEVKDKEDDYKRCVSTLDEMSEQIIEMKNKLGECEKTCPVCETVNAIENKYCDRCGWTFNPPFEVKPKVSKEHLFKAKSIWNDLRKRSNNDEEVLRIQVDEIRKLKEVCDVYREQLKEKEEQVNVVLEDNEKLKRKCADLNKKMRKYKETEQKAREEEKSERKTFKVGGISFNMIRVKAGGFMMGSDDNDAVAYQDEKPRHKVTLTKDYYIGETEVTQALWMAVMVYNPAEFIGENRPVETVSWDECQEFIKKLNKELPGTKFRLPTEADWEYAARGGNKGCKNKCIYSGSPKIDDVAWYESNSGGETHDVKSKDANELGLYDMTGNVCEWCADMYGEYKSLKQVDPIGTSGAMYYVVRGGSWYSNYRLCRVACRASGGADNSTHGIGLRLVLSD